MDEMTGLIEHAPMDTRVASVHDLFERVTVDGREEHAVAIWKEPADEGVNRSASVSSWLRRAGAGRVLNSRGTTESAISIPHPKRSRGWLAAAIVECERCHQVVERASPIQRHCLDCRLALKRERSTDAVRRRRAGLEQR
jgi:hypothetical protein